MNALKNSAALKPYFPKNASGRFPVIRTILAIIGFMMVINFGPYLLSAAIVGFHN